MKNMNLHFVPLLLFASVLNCNLKVTESEPDLQGHSLQDKFNLLWAMDKLWDDGNAEVAIYEAERMVYNEKRNFEYTILTVKEDFNKQFNVKTDDYLRNDLFPVIKVNMQCNFQTDYYWYHYLTTIFTYRNAPAKVFKLTNGSQELCGGTFKEFLQKPEGYAYHFHSYFDGQGDGDAILKEPDALFEDQLLYTLRSLKFEEGMKFSAKLIPSQITNEAAPIILRNVQLNVQKTRLEGSECWNVNLTGMITGRCRMVFERIPECVAEDGTSDGRKLDLKDVKRFQYWLHPNFR